ncbi:MAG: A/G-specific adenine glycosylase [Thiothrix sp.]|nr:A/G-specific adenine glycosylase [Thiothrix sp.]HPE61023.1 A/G-specific adenine glycosylase [Thiolinea sp.]
MTNFAVHVLDWYDQHGRRHLPWQQNPTLYRVWVSEIMLQQTQVATVIPYYQRFMARFPDLITLADADTDQVLKHWEGLGYYSRARNLHRCAQVIRDQHHGRFPTDLETVMNLPGIGRSTAGAILSLAQGQAHPILDGNVKRVLARYHAIQGYPGINAVQQQLWQHAERHLPDQRNAAYTQAMMDLGAMLCTRSKPACLLCPLRAGCQAARQGNPQDYPGRKPARVLPEKTRFALVLRNPSGDILLEQRPPTGVWGGLWSFPEFPDRHSALVKLSELAGRDSAAGLHELPLQTHAFSHYRLQLQLLLADLGTPETGIMEAGQQLWYKAGTEFGGGLSSAAQQLLKLLENHS